MQSQNSKTKSQKGQSIIEATVAISIVALIIVALVSAITVSVRNATYAKNKSLATKYVTEGIEAVRSIRDNSWLTFYDAAGDGAYIDYGIVQSSGQWQFSGSQDTPATGFTRVVSLQRPAGTTDVVEVKVKVTWLSSTTTPFSTEATTRFSRPQ